MNIGKEENIQVQKENRREKIERNYVCVEKRERKKCVKEKKERKGGKL